MPGHRPRLVKVRSVKFVEIGRENIWSVKVGVHLYVEMKQLEKTDTQEAVSSNLAAIYLLPRLIIVRTHL